MKKTQPLSEWVRDHKKLALLLGIATLLVLGLLITLLVTVLYRNPASEEPEMTASVMVSDINILYNDFSDYTIGYIINALNAALVQDTSMKSGIPASKNKTPPIDATNDELYPSINEGNYSISIKDNKISDYEDSWGLWKTFIVVVSDGRSFTVNVALGAHNRNNDVGYTKIDITRL